MQNKQAKTDVLSLFKKKTDQNIAFFSARGPKEHF